MHVKNTTGDDVDLPALGLRVPAGGIVEVTGDDATSLLEQGWARTDHPKPRQSAKTEE